jgi:hypothetical protein
MEYCTLNDAFPAEHTPGGGAASETKKERKRRCKPPPSAWMEGHADESELMSGARGLGGFDKEASEARSVGSSGQVDAPVPCSAYEARQAPSNTTAAKAILRVTEGPNTLIDSASAQPPSYFGADPDADTGSTLRRSKLEGFANYNPIPGKKDYMMETDFAQTFQLGGADKPTGAELPVPSIADRWKKMTPKGAQSSFFELLPAPGGSYPEYVVGQQGGIQQAGIQANNDMKKRLDAIFARLDDLEQRVDSGGENTQTEIFLFILSGVFVMFAADLLARR